MGPPRLRGLSLNLRVNEQAGEKKQTKKNPRLYCLTTFRMVAEVAVYKVTQFNI